MSGTPMTSSTIVALEGVTADYGGANALREVSLAVPRGSVYALLGRNGAGKTTALRCLLGQLRASAGRSLLFGRDSWRHRAALLEKVGVVPETPDAPPAMTVRRLAAFCASLYPSWDGPALFERIRRVGVDPGSRFGALSRGQRATVLLALALAPSPDLVVLDDPTLGLDAVARRTFLGELIDELSERGTTVLLSTHDLDGVERIAQRVGILHQGRMLVEKPLDELKREHGDRPLEEIFVSLVGQGGAG
jgi:ABC-2 type transport system ATP-binding protein